MSPGCPNNSPSLKSGAALWLQVNLLCNKKLIRINNCFQANASWMSGRLHQSTNTDEEDRDAPASEAPSSPLSHASSRLDALTRLAEASNMTDVEAVADSLGPSPIQTPRRYPSREEDQGDAEETSLSWARSRY